MTDAPYIDVTRVIARQSGGGTRSARVMRIHIEWFEEYVPDDPERPEYKGAETVIWLVDGIDLHVAESPDLVGERLRTS